MNQLNVLSRSIALALSALLAASVLSGCGSSDDRKTSSTDSGHDHDHGEDGHDHGDGETSDVAAEMEQGRLFITEEDGSQAYVYSLAQNEVIQTLSLTGQADAVKTSPESNYAVVMDRTNQAVNFYHSGIEIEDHGDHDHPYARDASKMPLQLNYTRPVHFQTFNDQAGLFFDGLGAAGNPIENPEQEAGFALVTDAGIASGELPYQQLSTNMHGTAEPRGGYVISSERYDTVGSSLADTLSVYRQHNDHYHISQTFDTKCMGLHGSGSVTDYSVFACSDGLVSINQIEDEFSAEKITYPASVTNIQCPSANGDSSPARIGSFITNHHHEFMIGNACGQPYHVDPANKDITPITWTTDSSRQIVSYAFDAHGEYLMLLDDTGKLHLLDVAQNYKQTAVLDVFPNGIEDDSHSAPSFISNPNTEMVYMLDPSNNKIIVIDPDAGQLESAIELTFTPSHVAWFGLQAGHDDEHEHTDEESHDHNHDSDSEHNHSHSH
ncbi:hypothetical protein [Psychrobacter sp.]|uniref:hypothetical protein n=1 Tax=Psychrobacter sp. TaxID=56811 RepID=UPI00264A2CCE|nr:hypothetical protein [Psychrobacter sp.]MDN6276107.1 hypothetical protein [Psychrobacter sp.]MDN6308544.1 hypothetical protein [Psychrobacter sp.]